MHASAHATYRRFSHKTRASSSYHFTQSYSPTVVRYDGAPKVYALGTCGMAGVRARHKEWDGSPTSPSRRVWTPDFRAAVPDSSGFPLHLNLGIEPAGMGADLSRHYQI